MPNKASLKTLVIGCGYIGRPLGARLSGEGHGVTGWVHSHESASALDRNIFEKVVIGDVGQEEAWQNVEKDFALVIHCASSGRGGSEAYEEVFQKGVRRLGEYQPGAKKILVSSTSVYGQSDGQLVTEKSTAEPQSETSRILRSAEEEALRLGFIVVRSAGIYGPGRARLFEKLRRGDAVMEGDGLRWMNQIHQRDLVAALLHLAVSGHPGEIYNAADDAPVSHRDYYQWCAEFLRVPLPPSGELPLQRKRGVTHKQVSNAKLRAAGWAAAYPSFREGLTADYSPR